MAIETLNLAITGDFHITNGKGTELSHAMLEKVVDHIGSSNPDGALIVGDMTDTGSRPAAELVARALRTLTDAKIPVVAVFGNHDYKTGNVQEKKRRYKEVGGVFVLDGELFALKKKDSDNKRIGILGFTGGYDGSLYTGSREYQVPKFEGHDLEKALHDFKSLLARTPYSQNIALTHYNAGFSTMSYTLNRAAITAGSVRTEEVVSSNQDKLDAVVHGHTHRARPTGKIGTVDVICGSMQISLYEARVKNKKRVTAEDFYTTYSLKLRP